MKSKTKRKKPVRSDTFFMTFIGEYVSVLTTMMVTKAFQTEDGVEEQTQPIVIQGFLLDMDDEFFYIGEVSNEVDRAVRKEFVNAIEIADENESTFDSILEHVEAPEDSKKYN